MIARGHFYWFWNKSITIKASTDTPSALYPATLAVLLHCLPLFITWSGFLDMCTHRQQLHIVLIDFVDFQQLLLIHSQFEQTDALWLADKCNNKHVNASRVLWAKKQPFHMSHSGIDWQVEACLCWHTFFFFYCLSLFGFLSMDPSFWVSALFFLTSHPFYLFSAAPLLH